ncbi:MAG: DNA polymerase III subunit delta [Chlamydiales bacterium]
MKCFDLDSFKKIIASELPRLSLILSSEEEEHKRAVREMANSSSISFTTFSAESFSAQAFMQEVETMPCFENHKIVSVRGIDKLQKDDFEAVQAYSNKPNHWVTLVLTAFSLPPQCKLVKIIEKNGLLLFFRKEKQWEHEKRVTEWLMKEAKEAGAVLPLPVAQALIKSLGTDHESLLNELEKLICYVGERRQITLRDLQKIATSIHQETLWQLGDAIFWRKRSDALEIGQNLTEEGIALFSLIAHLRAQVQTGMHVLTTFWAEGEPAVTREFPYLKGSLLSKKLQMLKNYGFESLQKAMIHLLEIELKAKNNIANPSLLLEILIAKLTNDTVLVSECARCC